MTYTAALESLKELMPGWDGYDGKPTTKEAIDTATYMTVCPHSNGGLQIEMHAGGVDIEIEVAPDGKVISVLYADMINK